MEELDATIFFPSSAIVMFNHVYLGHNPGGLHRYSFNLICKIRTYTYINSVQVDIMS